MIEMAFFWLWMACFFIMAIFWKYMRPWFTRKDKKCLQVRSKQCQKLCTVILSLEKCLKAMEASSKTKVLNKNQCVHLLNKFLLAMKGIDKMLSNATLDLQFQSIFEELCYLHKKVEIVRENCIEQERWCHSAIFQLQNKETFRELLLDLECCYDTTRDLYSFYHPNRSNDILSIDFDAAIYEQVFEDGEDLRRKLELVLQGEISKDYEIAQHLLLRLRNLDRVDGGNLDGLEIPNDFKTPKLIKLIGVGSNGHVHKSNWLGLECATKVLEGDHEFLMNSRKEVGILAGLSHPNLVQFFGCGINKEIDEIPMDVDTSEITKMYMVMELMESSLSTILKKAKKPLPYHLAIDIMHQIAKGVYYLHDMQVAHLGLKPDSILYNSIPMEDLDPCRIFKVIDFGTSQIEVFSNPKHLEPPDYTIGTRGYTAPEMIKGSNIPRYPFQADVWSFAMVCSEILTKKVPYSDLKLRDFYNQMKGTHGPGLRPDLPNNCKELTNLIQECWSQDPLQRPTFSNICKRLTRLKKSFLKGTYPYEMLPKFGSSHAFKDSYVPQVEEPIAPPKQILVDLEHQLSQAKRLLKMNYIGIVGMGGIGKTTLAKAIFDDVAVNSSYHASCFVAECKNDQNSYEILCEILPKLGNDKKPKDLEVARRMMIELFIRKKVLLVLDDIKDESQVHDIVPPDIVQASKGTTIIITTRKWNTIKSFVGIEGRFDVGLLDDKVATELFTTHLSWGVAPLSPDFKDLSKHLVKACNGLPLSLKVMGAFLHNKERLRSWERALQRMARGRNLNRDEEIWNTLKISFDGLEDDVEKKMFLDVACFFCRDVYPSGISKETILSMWSKDGILPVRELERLIDMSLLKVNEDCDILEMHDQLRDMGRMIAKGTRIWKASMIPERRFSSTDVESIEGISLQGIVNHHVLLLKQDPSFDFEELRVLILVSALGNPEAQITNLDLLFKIALQCSQLEAILVGNSQNLIELPHTLPATIATTLSNMISNLCSTRASLKILDLIGLEFLEKLPNKFASKNTLLRLNLSSCSNLVSLPKEVGNLSSLTTLNLEECSSLVSLPKEMGKLSSLMNLYLSFCSRLATLPKEVGNLSSLTTLYLIDCSRLATLPKEVGNLSSLTTLYLRGCLRLEALPTEVGNLSSLITLDLSGCSSLTTLPEDLGNLSSLTTLNLCFCSSLVALPKEVGNLSSVTTLDLRGCLSLVSFPKEVGDLSSLITLDLTGCSNMTTLPKEVGNLSSLTTLDLCFCSSLVSLPKEVGNLSSLIILNLSGCSSLVALPKEVENLSTILDLKGCSNLVALPKEVGVSTSWTSLDLDGSSSLAALSQDMENLSSLTTPNLDGCSNLSTLPKKGEISSSLKTYLEECSSKAQVQTIGDDELKKQQQVANLSTSFNDVIQEFLLKIFSFLKTKGLGVLGSLLPWVQIYTNMSSQQVLSKNKGKVESKDLLTKRFLGQGCSGIFYETTWSMDHTVKFARKDFPGVPGDTFAMETIPLFELEDHPNIVKTFCWTVENRSCSLVMEYMKDDLSSFMRKKKEALRKKGDQKVIRANPLPFQLLEVLEILLQIAIGVEYIHDKGLYHGNLKPNNVLLDWKEGEMLVKVADFGLFETKKNTTLLSQRALCYQMIEWNAPELFEDFFSSMSDDLDFLWTTSLTKLDPSTSNTLCFGNGPKVMLDKVDSYSFGLISAYVLGGEQMWPTQLSPQKLRKKISSNGLRPNLPSKCPKTLASLIHACWDASPTCRPTFSIIRNKLQEIIKEQRK